MKIDIFSRKYETSANDSFSSLESSILFIIFSVAKQKHVGIKFNRREFQEVRLRGCSINADKHIKLMLDTYS